MPCANGIWIAGRRNWNEDFEMPADDRNCTGHFGTDAFCLALHGADLHKMCIRDRRITSLVQKGRYLTEQEQAQYNKIQA